MGVATAAPISHDDAGAIPEAAPPVSALVAPPEGDARTETSSGNPPEGKRRSGAAAPSSALEALPSEAPASAATLPRRAPTAALVDEDPQVEIADVVGSVARATSVAVPWLRFGKGQQDDAQGRREAARAEAEADMAHRLDNAAARSDSRPGSEGDGRQGSGSPLHVNLVDEAIEVARDFIANPLTWIFGVPIAVVGLMVAVLRGRRH